MFVATVFYSIWWTVESIPGNMSNDLFLKFSFLSSVLSVIMLFLGSHIKAPVQKGLSHASIIFGAIGAFFVLLVVSQVIFYRPITDDIFMVIFWPVLELVAINALFEDGFFGFSQAKTSVILLSIVAVIDLVCYLFYYQTENFLRFLCGFVPIAVNEIFVTILLITQWLSEPIEIKLKKTEADEKE